MFFDESIGGYFRYANSPSAFFSSADYLSGNQTPAGSAFSHFPSIYHRINGVKAVLLRILCPAVTGPSHRPSDEEVSVTRLTLDYDGIPRTYDFAESCLESVRSNGNSFSGITSICHIERNIARWKHSRIDLNSTSRPRSQNLILLVDCVYLERITFIYTVFYRYFLELIALFASHWTLLNHLFRSNASFYCIVDKIIK